MLDKIRDFQLQYPVEFASPVGFQNFCHQYWDEIKAYNSIAPKTKKVAKPSIPEIKIAWEIHQYNLHLEKIKELEQKIKFTKDNQLIKEFILCLTGDLKSADVAGLQHFLWQIKRKIFNLSTIWELFVMFYGTQGSGKSYSLTSLLEPLAGFVIDSNFVDLKTDKFKHELGRNFVCVFDEMARHNTMSEFETLKHLITAKEISAPILYHSNYAKLPQRASFIGTSNKELRDMVFDSTGMRRFLQINCLSKEELEKNWEQIKKINYLQLWQGIDENLTQGYWEDSIVKAQIDLVTPDSIEHWVDEFNLLGGEKVRVPAAQLYLKYSQFMQGRPFISPGAFGRKLETLGIRAKRTATKRLREINSHNTLFTLQEASEFCSAIQDQEIEDD